MSARGDERLHPARSRLLLPLPFTAEQLALVPVLRSADELLIDDLTDAEDDVFAAALAPVSDRPTDLEHGD